MSRPLNVPQTGDWRHRFEFFGPDGVTPEDISTAIPSLVLRRQIGAETVTLTTDEGLIVGGLDNAFDVAVDKSSVALWQPGLWVGDIGLVWPDGYDDAAASIAIMVTATGGADNGVTQVLRRADGTRIVRVSSGPPGVAGTPGGSFTHTQSSPSVDWTVNHNLGFRPTVAVLTTGGVEVEAHVVHTSTTQLHVYLAAPATGSVRCN